MSDNDNYIRKYTYENLVAIACEENDVNALIKLHKELIGKNVKTYEYLDKIVDGGVKLVFDLFERDEGRSIVYHYSFSESEFIHSTYLSSYFKDSIKKLLGDSIEEELANILNSDKDINDMEEEEIKVIKDTLDSFYSNPNYKPVSNIAASFMTYLYKLEGIGVTSYIKNNISKDKIAYHCMFTSGLIPRADFYSGRGVKECDLNADNLVSIFNKLCVLDKEYALEFVEMVNSMKTLGATEFIESFYNFAWNGFKHFAENVVDSNISFGNSNESRHAIALGTILSTIHSSDRGIQIYMSKLIVNDFMWEIRKKLRSIDPENKYLPKKRIRRPYGLDGYLN